MKTKFWILILGVLTALCLLGTFLAFRTGAPASTVTVISDGKVLCTLPLNTDRVLKVEGKQGVNTVTIKDGKVAVTEADCPDGHCMKRGFCDGGAQIVCLPNRLVLRFSAQSELDGISG